MQFWSLCTDPLLAAGGLDRDSPHETAAASIDFAKEAVSTFRSRRCVLVVDVDPLALPTFDAAAGLFAVALAANSPAEAGAVPASQQEDELGHGRIRRFRRS